MTPVTVRFNGRPAEAASTDKARPTLNGVWIDPPKDKKESPVATATDSYRLAQTPVTVIEGEVKERIWIPSEYVKEVTKGRSGGQLRITDEHFEPLTHLGVTRDVLYRRHKRDEPTTLPNPDALFPDYKHTYEIGLNAELLFGLAKALGGFQKGVKLIIDVDAVKKDGSLMRAMRVEPLGGSSVEVPPARGILMPVRVNI